MDIFQKVPARSKILIFGAGVVAKNELFFLSSAPFYYQIMGCIVSCHNNNPKKIGDIPVYDLSEAESLFSPKTPIFIAVVEKNLASVYDSLLNSSFNNTIPLTFEGDLLSEMENLFLVEYAKNNSINYSDLNKINTNIVPDNNSYHIYSVHTIYDKKISECTSQEWLIPIQAGSALTDTKICDIRDNIGDNISDKNKSYCELTALYWIWKNDSSEVKGLCHYRRPFKISKENIERLYQSDIDFLVTYPIINYPSVLNTYKHDHIIDDYYILRDAIINICPEYLNSFDNVWNGFYYYAYNMFIAKSKYFDSYCSFLFPLLNYCEDHCKDHENAYQKRYIGFLAERLLKVYLDKNQKSINVKFIPKMFLH